MGGNVVAYKDSSVQCYGYQSCRDSTLIETIENHIFCRGSYSCYNSDTIRYTGSDVEKNVYCYGLNACSNTNSIASAKGDIRCSAEQACVNTQLNASINVQCLAYRSCQTSNVTGLSVIRLNGVFSGLNSIFYSGDDSEITDVDFEMSAFDGGYNTTIVCNENDTCNILCYGSSCNDLNLICDTNCNMNINCINAQQSDNCPNGMCIFVNLS